MENSYLHHWTAARHGGAWQTNLCYCFAKMTGKIKISFGVWSVCSWYRADRRQNWGWPKLFLVILTVLLCTLSLLFRNSIQCKCNLSWNKLSGTVTRLSTRNAQFYSVIASSFLSLFYGIHPSDWIAWAHSISQNVSINVVLKLIHVLFSTYSTFRTVHVW